ncbi:MAG TPA: DUF3995 domain-containing protein [Solirubrobacter sp.]|nr:DUF3995 domain-containing protein [Solirubrobacter sp.]
MSTITLPTPRRTRSLAWAPRAAAVWAIAYAVGVRGYQGLGGTVGLPGQVEDPAGLHRASLLAGVFLLLVGLAALSLGRRWTLRLPRALVLVPAVAGSTYALGHALTGFITKPLDLLGVIDLEFKGWAHVNETALALWDILFYEPWFLGLGILVTLASLHHHRLAGGSERGARRIVAATALATLALTVTAITMILS